MSLMPLLCLSSVLINLVTTSSGVCKVVTVKNSIFQKGKVLWGFQFYRLNRVPDVLQCARQCYFRQRCLSFNYKEKSTTCEFNNARVDAPDVVLGTSTDYIYSDIDDWDEAIGMGPCWDQPCGMCEACYPTEFNYTCVPEEYTSCRDIKICTNASSDGHYLVRPVMGTKPWLKVYCHEMASNYPGDYLTLLGENFSKFPPLHHLYCSRLDWSRGQIGAMFYKKIRLDLTVLKVIKTDKTFTNVSCYASVFGISDPKNYRRPTCGVNYDYGSAGDCIFYTCKPRRGNFQINLEGTGLSFLPSVQFINHGYKSTISSIYRSPSNEVIRGVCGGNCGWCEAKGDIYLEPKT